jgi:hypothetical protein
MALFLPTVSSGVTASILIMPFRRFFVPLRHSNASDFLVQFPPPHCALVHDVRPSCTAQHLFRRLSRPGPAPRLVAYPAQAFSLRNSYQSMRGHSANIYGLYICVVPSPPSPVCRHIHFVCSSDFASLLFAAFMGFRLLDASLDTPR